MADIRALFSDCFGTCFATALSADNLVSCVFGKRLRDLHFFSVFLKEDKMYCFKHLPQEYLQRVVTVPSVHLSSQNILQSFDAFLIAISQTSLNQTSPKLLQCLLLKQQIVQKHLVPE